MSHTVGSRPARLAESWGMATVRLIKHEVISDCGSFEVRFADGRPSQCFYWEDLPGRRLRQDMLTSDVALEQAKALDRAERDRQLATTARVIYAVAV